MRRRIRGQDGGFTVVRLAIVAAVAVPGGTYVFRAVRDGVADETLRSDMRNAISIESECNADRNGRGFVAGASRPGGPMTLRCGATVESLQSSSGNRLTIVISPDERSYAIFGERPETGVRLRYDSASGRWSP